MKTKRKVISILFTAIWIISVVLFWIFALVADAGYVVAFMWFAIPICLMVLSFQYYKGHKNWRMAFVFGFAYMLSDYCTSKLAYSILHNKITPPNVIFFIVGTFLSFVCYSTIYDG